jgi:hypothetical protein
MSNLIRNFFITISTSRLAALFTWLGLGLLSLLIFFVVQFVLTKLAEAQYWDGYGSPETPLFAVGPLGDRLGDRRMTYAAHNEMAKCGLTDEAIRILGTSNLDTRITTGLPGDFKVDGSLLLPFDNAPAPASQFYGLASKTAEGDTKILVLKVVDGKPAVQGTLTLQSVRSDAVKLTCG